MSVTRVMSGSYAEALSQLQDDCPGEGRHARACLQAFGKNLKADDNLVVRAGERDNERVSVLSDGDPHPVFHVAAGADLVPADIGSCRFRVQGEHRFHGVVLVLGADTAGGDGQAKTGAAKKCRVPAGYAAHAAGRLIIEGQDTSG